MEETDLLMLTNGILVLLLVLSELIGWSQCKVNSITEYCHDKFICSTPQE